MCFFFFFKKKTASEMRISDGSSDVCSSDLLLQDYALADQQSASVLEAYLDRTRPEWRGAEEEPAAAGAGQPGAGQTGRGQAGAGQSGQGQSGQGDRKSVG